MSLSDPESKRPSQPHPILPHPVLPHWSLYVAVLLASLSVAQLLIRGGPLVGYPHELRYGEAIVLDQARRVVEEPGLYPEIDSEPWLLDQYAPFYPYLAQWFGKLSDAPYWGGRMLSLISTLGSATVLTLIVRRSSGLTAGLLCGSVMLTMTEFLRFGFLMRVDPLALFLAMLGVWCHCHRRTAVRFAGAVAFFFAVYTRQTTIALLLVSYLGLWLREGRAALRWPVGLLAAGLLFYAILSANTDGHFHQHAVMSNLFPFHWASGIQKWLAPFVPYKLPLFIATFLALVPGSGKGVDGARVFRIGIYLSLAVALLLCIPVLTQPGGLQWVLSAQGVLLVTAVALLFRREVDTRIDGARIVLALSSMALIGRIGSDLNYLFEGGVLILLVCGTAIGRAPPLRAMMIGSLLVIQVLIGVYLSRDLTEFQPERLEEIEFRQRVVDRLAEFPDPVLSEEPWAVAEAGRPMVIEPFTARQMYESGMWSGEDLIDALDARQYSAIVRAKQRVAAGYEKDQDGQIVFDPIDGMPVPYFGPWTFNHVRSLPPKIQQAIDRNYQPVPRTTMIEKVTKYYLEGREIWEPIPR
ncbi:MAG: hypothetical protein OSB09_06710 [Planctomycetota bacterium]|nr:hypothetical protein [Planctomycetota bacterium]